MCEMRRQLRPRQASHLAGKMREWEQALPGNWLSRIGMLALFIGLGFLAKLAFDRGWVGPVPQLLAGLGVGALFLLAGHHWREAYRGWAQAITGGGIGILYLSVFGSYGLHHLMPFLATFILMFMVTVLAVGIALRRDSMSIAILGVVGAFLVPITLGAIDQSGDGSAGNGGSNTGLMAAYILTLDVAVVGLASVRNWRWFTLLGFGGSMAVFGLWYGTTDHESVVGQAEGLVTGIFLCFAAATTLFHGLKKQRAQLTDLALMTLNAAVYFGITHFLLWEGYRGWLGMIGFGLAGFYALKGYLFLRRSRENSLLAAFAFGVAIVFLTVAIPVQLEKSWMTAAWAAEGAVLIWLAVRYGTPRWQTWGLGALGLAVIRLFAFDQFAGREDFTPVLNDMFWGFAPAALAFVAAAWFLRHREKALRPWLFPVMVLVANFLAVWLLSSEIINFAHSRIMAGHENGAIGYDLRSVENARNLVLVALWVMYGLALIYGGTRKAWGWLRPGGYVLACMAIGTALLLLNHWRAGISGESSLPIVNHGFGALALCISALGLVAFLIRRYGEGMTESERGAFPVVVWAANILSVYALTVEVLTFISGPLNVRYLVLVALWSGYGLGVVIVGLRTGWAWLRAMGWLLALMAVGATMTTLNYGHLLMEEGPAHPIANFSFGGFAICIGVMTVLAWLVSRNREKLHGQEASLYPALVLLVNFLALWAVSSEVATFMEGSGNGQNLVLVTIWSCWGLAVVRTGIWKEWGWLRVAGYVLAVVAVGTTVTLLNHSVAGVGRGTDHMVVLNPSLAAFAICVAALYLLAWVMARNSSRLLDGEKPVLTAIIVAANALSLFALSSEVWTYAGGEEGKNLGLTVLWAAYGLVLMVAGIIGRWPGVRLGGLGLVSAAIVKLFLYDMVKLGGGYRVAAFMTTGILLLAGGFVYHRYADVIKGFIMDRPGKGTR